MHGIVITSMATYVGCSGVHVFDLFIYLETCISCMISIKITKTSHGRWLTSGPDSA